MATTYVEIELGGKKYGWKFNNFAWHEFVLKAMGKNYRAVAPYAMLWAGLVANAYVKGIELDCTFEQVCDWADDLQNEAPEKIKVLDDIIVSSLQFKKMIEDVQTVIETDDEKKRTSTNALASPSDV